MADVTISQLQLSEPSDLAIFPFSDNDITYKGAVSAIKSTKAWVNFDGTTVSSVLGGNYRQIRASNNIQSVLKNNPGQYTVTFNNQLLDSNYCVNIATSNNTSSTTTALITPFYSNLTNQSVDINLLGTLSPVYNLDSYSSNLLVTLPLNSYTGVKDVSNSVNISLVNKDVTVSYGGVTFSTLPVKYYSTSAYFNGSTNYYFANNAAFYFSGTYTIEAWINCTNVASYNSIFFVGNWNSNQGIRFSLDASKLAFSLNAGGRQINGTSTLANNTWYHVAVVNDGTNIKTYVNGVQDGSASATAPANNTSYVTIGAYIDTNYSPGTRYFFNGYIQDFRIYKGVAKYTSNFTPPIAIQKYEGNGSTSFVDVSNVSVSVIR